MGNEWRNKPRSPMDTSQGSGGADKKIVAFAVLLLAVPGAALGATAAWLVYEWHKAGAF